MLRLVLLLNALWSGAALADAKTLPASACQATTSSYASSFAISNGRAQNTSSSSTISIDCPVIDDTTGGIASAYVYAYDGSSSAAVECTMYSRYLSSSSSYATGTGASAGTGNYRITIGAVSSTNGTHFQHLYCRLPASSYLYGYWVNES